MADPTTKREVLFEDASPHFQARIVGDVANQPRVAEMAYQMAGRRFSLASQEGSTTKYKLLARGQGFRFVRQPGRVWSLPAPVKFYGFPDEVRAYYQNRVPRRPRAITDGTAFLVLDEGGEILSEYVSGRSQGQPGVGDRFIQWVFNVLGDETRCERVFIVPFHGGGRAWEEFPDDLALMSFHWDDQKFVAVAMASTLSPTIVNAVDNWATHSQALRFAGLEFLCLCPDMVAC